MIFVLVDNWAQKKKQNENRIREGLRTALLPTPQALLPTTEPTFDSVEAENRSKGLSIGSTPDLIISQPLQNVNANFSLSPETDGVVETVNGDPLP